MTQIPLMTRSLRMDRRRPAAPPQEARLDTSSLNVLNYLCHLRSLDVICGLSTPTPSGSEYR